jgi:peptidyl-prolyl cis-trans isomerase A (cyclophilin A)
VIWPILAIAGCAHHAPAMPPPAPAAFQAEFETTEGTFVVQVHRELAPRGADRFYQLVNDHFYDDVAFFRAIKGFMVQFGISGSPGVSRKWRDANLPDDPPIASNHRGAVTFAMAGPNTRTTQLFINLVDNQRLDTMGFAPFGEVIAGMDVVDRLYTGYGEGAPMGSGPDQGQIEAKGSGYLKNFPELDYTKRVRIIR